MTEALRFRVVYHVIEMREHDFVFPAASWAEAEEFLRALCTFVNRMVDTKLAADFSSMGCVEWLDDNGDWNIVDEVDALDRGWIPPESVLEG